MDNAGSTVLVLVGDAVQRDLIRLALERSNIQALVTQKEAQAIAWLQQRRPDLMVVDVLLPQINGLDLVQKCKEAGVLKQINVIMISALGYREIVERAAQLGVADFLVKPIDVEDLVERIKYVLNKGELSDEVS